MYYIQSRKNTFVYLVLFFVLVSCLQHYFPMKTNKQFVQLAIPTLPNLLHLCWFGNKFFAAYIRNLHNQPTNYTSLSCFFLYKFLF